MARLRDTVIRLRTIAHLRAAQQAVAASRAGEAHRDAERARRRRDEAWTDAGEALDSWYALARNPQALDPHQATLWGGEVNRLEAMARAADHAQEAAQDGSRRAREAWRLAMDRADRSREEAGRAARRHAARLEEARLGELADRTTLQWRARHEG